MCTDGGGGRGRGGVWSDFEAQLALLELDLTFTTKKKKSCLDDDVAICVTGNPFIVQWLNPSLTCWNKECFVLLLLGVFATKSRWGSSFRRFQVLHYQLKSCCVGQYKNALNKHKNCWILNLFTVAFMHHLMERKKMVLREWTVLSLWCFLARFTSKLFHRQMVSSPEIVATVDQSGLRDAFRTLSSWPTTRYNLSSA